MRDDDFLFGVRCTDEPKNKKKGHHSRHEICESDFPSAAMVTIAMASVPLDNDQLLMGLCRHLILLLRLRDQSQKF
jgi:hypothetical protein